MWTMVVEKALRVGAGLALAAPCALALGIPATAAAFERVQEAPVASSIEHELSKALAGRAALARGALPSVSTEVQAVFEQHGALASKAAYALLHGEVPECSSSQVRELLGALAQRPWSELVEVLGEAQPIERAGLPVLCAQALVIGSCAPASSLPELLEQVREIALAAPERRERAVLDFALESFFQRHPASATQLGPSTAFDGQVLELLVRALGRSRNASGLGFLLESLEAREELADLVLPQYQQIGPGHCLETNEAVTASLKRLFTNARPQTASAAARALGRFGNPDSAQALIEHATSPESALREACEWALCEISGLRLQGGADVWKRWLATEQAWYEVDRPGTLAELAGGNEVRVVSGLRDISQHRLFRHELAGQVAPLLTHAKQDVRLAACRALGDMRSPLATKALVEALSWPDEATRAAARDALGRVHQRELPADAASVRTLFGLEG